jgi:hypothetical protein
MNRFRLLALGIPLFFLSPDDQNGGGDLPPEGSGEGNGGTPPIDKQGDKTAPSKDDEEKRIQSEVDRRLQKALQKKEEEARLAQLEKDKNYEAILAEERKKHQIERLKAVAESKAEAIGIPELSQVFTEPDKFNTPDGVKEFLSTIEKQIEARAEAKFQAKLKGVVTTGGAPKGATTGQKAAGSEPDLGEMSDEEFAKYATNKK